MVIALTGYWAYFDASMNAAQDEMVVAGFASTLEEWEQFEIAWKLVRKWIRSIPSDLPMTFVFDQGDDGAGLLLQEMQSSELPSPVFKRNRPNAELDKDDPYLVQLQASDWAAWELRRGESDLEAGKLPSELRKSLVALNHRNKIWKQTLELDLQGLIQAAKIPLRQV